MKKWFGIPVAVVVAVAVVVLVASSTALAAGYFIWDFHSDVTVLEPVAVSVDIAASGMVEWSGEGTQPAGASVWNHGADVWLVKLYPCQSMTAYFDLGNASPAPVTINIGVTYSGADPSGLTWAGTGTLVVPPGGINNHPITVTADCGASPGLYSQFDFDFTR